MTALISIGNSDNKLSQRDWANYIASVRKVIRSNVCVQVHGEWFSSPQSMFQNAAWCFEIKDIHPNINPHDKRTELRTELQRLARIYNQDSIAWLEGETEFLKPLVEGL